MSTILTHSRARLGRVLEILAVAAMVGLTIHILLVVTGPNVADVRPYGLNFTGADYVMSVRGDLAFPVDFGDTLTWIDTENGTKDAATGLPPVELGGPVRAQLSFWDPTPSQRAAWAVGELFGPALTLAGIWIVYQLVRSTRDGSPFTADNERRLWLLAGLIAIGATLHGLITGFVTMLLIQRSAAADLFQVGTTISFLPLMLGLLIAMLAMVWRIGIHMREDLEGTI